MKSEQRISGRTATNRLRGIVWRHAIILTLGFSLAAPLRAEPIRLHPENPHYFLFQGKPTVLITSAEHYGAVVNRDFDYVAYLDTLQAWRLNYTRIYPGFLFEPVDKFIKGNTLAPKPEGLVLPWTRSDQPGYRLGGHRFDLSRWDSAFFSRLKDFVAKAGERGVVVEVCFFNAQYADTWPISPLYHENNVQGVGRCGHQDVQTLKHADLVQVLDQYVRKITTEVNEFDNVILEICDEPALTGTPFALAGPWIAHEIDVIRQTEEGLPKRHLIAQQVEGPVGGPCDFSNDPRVAVVTTQYVWDADVEQMGGMKALDAKYDCGKPIELNETNYYPVWYSGDKVAASRVEAWEFIVGGGAGFNHLNGVFTVANPTGNTPDNQQILQALRNLREFINSFEYLKMRPDRGIVTGGVPADALCRVLGEPGRQYALYLHHSKGAKGSCYTVTPGNYQENLTLRLPAGVYQVDWVEPASGRTIRADKITHEGGDRTLSTPSYTVDIALRITSKSG